jgi:hypothetical protein
VKRKITIDSEKKQKQHHHHMTQVDIVLTSQIQPWPHWQQVLFVVGGAISGALSILGSGMILYSILKEWKRKRTEVKYRFLLGLSVSDIITSLVFVLWPLPIPKGTPNVWGAMGNKESCSAQGFFLQMSAVGVFYNGALCHWFYYSIVKGVSDATYIQRLRWEKYWHIFNIGFPLITSSILVIFDVFNYSVVGCYVGEHPYGCGSDENVDCVVGENWQAFSWPFMGAPIVIMMMIVSFYMYQIYRHVNNVLDKAQDQIVRSSMSAPTPSLGNNPNDQNSRSNDGAGSSQLSKREISSRLSGALKESYDKMEHRKQEAAKQGYFYIGIFFVTHFWNLFVAFLDIADIPQPFWLPFLAQIFWPSQGFFNMFVFCRTRIAILRQRFPMVNICLIVYWSIFYFDETTGQLRTSAMPEGQQKFLLSFSPSAVLSSIGIDIEPTSRVSSHLGPQPEESGIGLSIKEDDSDDSDEDRRVSKKEFEEPEGSRS